MKNVKVLNLKTIREQYGYTATYVSNVSGVPLRTITRYEAECPGADLISFDAVYHLSLVFGLPVEKMFVKKSTEEE